jgi:hypothetical protein
MGLQAWMVNFKSLHQRAKDGALDARELERYQAAREELAQALLGAQRIEVRPGETARGSLRVAKAMQIDLAVPGGRQRAMTLDLSSTSLSAMLGIGLGVGERFDAVLKMPAGAPPLECQVEVISSKRQGGTYRVAFNFVRLPPADIERIGFVIYDAAIDTFQR